MFSTLLKNYAPFSSNLKLSSANSFSLEESKWRAISPFPQYFLPFWRTLPHFYQIQNCRLQTLSIWKSLKFLIWERVKAIYQMAQSFDDHKEEERSLLKTFWEKEKLLITSISPFTTMVSSFTEIEIIIFTTICLFSVNAFSLDKIKICLPVHHWERTIMKTEIIVSKGKNAGYHSVFYPLKKIFSSPNPFILSTSKFFVGLKTLNLYQMTKFGLVPTEQILQMTNEMCPNCWET